MTKSRTIAIILAASVALQLIAPRTLAEDPAPAAAKTVDLSTPVSATKAFFAATKARDYATVAQILAPAIKAKLTTQAVTTEAFVAKLEAEIGATVSIADEPFRIKEEKAKVPVTFNQSKRGLHVENIDLVQIDGKWVIESF